MTRVTIKAVDIFDDEVVEEIQTLDRLAFGDTAPVLEPDGGHWWLAFVEGAAVGYGGYMRALNHPEMAYLCRSGVLQSYRGHGIQRRLIRIRETHARRCGFAGMVTDTTDNLVSANNLIRCGFRLFTPRVYWAFQNSLYWRKVF